MSFHYHLGRRGRCNCVFSTPVKRNRLTKTLEEIQEIKREQSKIGTLLDRSVKSVERLIPRFHRRQGVMAR